MSYRESHIGRGHDYHQTFADLPYRALLWELEQRVLSDVLKRYDRGSLAYLDFACGTGRILAFVEPMVREATGIDVSKSMLDVARSRVRTAHLVEADLTREQVFDPDRFDVITAFRFFPNAENALRDAVMRELATCLKPEGLLIFGNHRHTDSIRNRIKRMAGREVDGMSAEDGESLVRSHGLEVLEIVPLGIWPGRESRRIAGTRIATWAERWASRAPLCRKVANTLVYVCTKRAPA